MAIKELKSLTFGDGDTYVPAPTAWNEIPGNPFGGGCSTVSWASAGIDFNTLPPATWIKVSDAVITMEDFEAVTNEDHFITWISHWEENLQIMCNIDASDFLNAIFDNGDGTVSIYIVDGMGNMIESVKFTPDGVLFYTGEDWDYRAYPLSVTVPRSRKFESSKTIDSKYLPEGSRTETVSLSQTLTYDTICDINTGDIDHQKMVKEKWFGSARMVSDANIPVKSCYHHSFENVNIYTIGYGENEWGWYQLDAEEIGNGFYRLHQTDENGNTVWGGYCATDESIYDTGLYLYEWYGGSFSFDLGPIFEVRTPKPIDKKYLPDDIGGGVSEEYVTEKLDEYYNEWNDNLGNAMDGVVYHIEQKGYQTEAQVNTLINARTPSVTEADNGKFLRVVDGAWAAVSVPNAEGVGF